MSHMSLMDPPQHRRITRHRELRACTECRKRKLKCDRRLPCTSCVRRDEAPACVYARSGGHNHDHRNPSQAEARLEHLEELIQELSKSRDMSIDNGLPTPEDSNTVHSDRAEIPFEPLHNGATHWSAILDDIDELRNVIRDHDGFGNKSTDYNCCDSDGVLFGASKRLLFHQVLSQLLPTRQQADRLVGAYFRNRTVAAPFIHTAQFHRLYQSFWEDTSRASPLWTSILFSILGISSSILSGSSSIDDKKRADEFAAGAAHCLATGEYYRPQRFSVEALLLYAHAKCLKGSEIGPDLAVLLGTLVRLATAMGYHRDADGSKGKISVFDGEIRRRTWSLCIQIDTLVSFQLGLPTNIQFPTWDTKPPTNLLDSDFDEYTKELPAARPDNEPTELLFYIAKHKLMAVFEKVIRYTLSATERPHEELEEIEQDIRETFANLPLCYQPRVIAESIIDSPSLIVARLCVYTIYQKSLCVLHRKYITRGNENSLQVCYTAATDLIRQFLDIYQEFEAGGQLETERWFIGSITQHDFLLACTTLCLCVCYHSHYTTKPTTATATTTIIDVTVSLNLLQDAKIVCQNQLAIRRDAIKVQRLIGATIQKCNSRSNKSTSSCQPLLDNGQVAMSQLCWPATAPADGEDWSWSENMMDSTDDGGWAFLEQFLALQSNDGITQTG